MLKVKSRKILISLLTHWDILAETALLSINNDVHLSLACSKLNALVLLNRTAAFSTIDHHKPLGYRKNLDLVLVELFLSGLSST